MKIKQIADELKEQMPKNLNELETLRYIYIYLGKKKSFDPTYYFGNEDVKKKIYRLSMQNLRNEEFLASNKNLICTSISSALSYIGKEFGIDIEIFKEQDNKYAHMNNVAKLKDGRRIHLDLQQDLKFIHTGQKTESFGDSECFCTKIDDEQLQEIDEKIGYKTKGKGYKEDIIVDIVLKLMHKGELEKVRSLLNDEEFNEILKEDGYVELEKFVDGCLQCIGAINTDLITCYRDETINKEPLPEKQYSMCIFSREKKEENENYKIYMFKQKEKRFIEVSVERMRRLTEQGLKFKQNGCNSHAVKILRKILQTKDNTLEK